MIKLLPLLGLMLCGLATAEQDLVDPTRPYVGKDATGLDNQDLNLDSDNQVTVSAIFVSEQSKHAIIDGKHYSIGQRVLGNKIISIEAHRVIVSGADGLKEFFINNNNIKKDVSHDF